MSGRYEFAFHELPAGSPSVDSALARMGADGWEIRGLAMGADGAIVVALQRPLASTVVTQQSIELSEGAERLSALEEPLVAPSAEELNVSGAG